VAQAQDELGVSERRACKVLGQARAVQRHTPQVRDDEGRLTRRIVELAAVYGRYGKPRIEALLRREGWLVNHKRVERIWKQAGLKVPQRQPKRGRLWLNDGSYIHDAVGNLTDDFESWKYKYDAFGRLVKLTNQSNATVAEYTYYGNNFRASEHYDADADGDVDGSDPTYNFAWDEGWPLAAVYRGSDANPKERFLHHQAGNSGYGSSSYIDSLVLRDRDANTAWTSASDGTLEERRYSCQSWRHDVVAMVTSGGALAERARYSAYGVAFGIPLGDVNGDGVRNSTDDGFYSPTLPTGIRFDLNLDGVVSSTDAGIASGAPSVTLGRGKLSNIGNRFGYASYESDFISDLLMHVRNRVYHAILGRWIRRDPLGYVDGASLYQYVSSRPITGLDAMGLDSLGCVGFGGPGECPGGEHTQAITTSWLPPLGPILPFLLEPQPQPCCLDSEDSDCEAACAASPGSGGVTIWEGNGLGIKCCICTNSILNAYPLPRWEPDVAGHDYGVQIISDCIGVHESVHMAQPNPKADVCARLCGEAAAYEAQLSCLQAKMNECRGSTACWNVVLQSLKQVAKQAQAYRNECSLCVPPIGGNPPPPSLWW